MRDEIWSCPCGALQRDLLQLCRKCGKPAVRHTPRSGRMPSLQELLQEIEREVREQIEDDGEDAVVGDGRAKPLGRW